MKNIKKLLICTTVLLFSTFAYADIAPVRVITNFNPPYSPRISDWLNSMDERFTVNLLLRDLNIHQGKVILKLHIESSNVKIYSKDNLNIASFSLDGGVPLLLSGFELRDFFNANNLIFEGISMGDYLNSGGRLPDGQYKIWFEAFESQSGLKVSSSEVPAIVWLQDLDAPIIISPHSRAEITSGTTNIIFSWQAMHLGQPSANFTTNYLFELVQVPQNYNGSIENLFAYYPTYCSENFSTTSFLYDESFPALVNNFEYAFRVKAYNANDEDASYFKNNGYSEVVILQYFDQCLPPENIEIEINNPYTAILRWEFQDKVLEYQVNYRKQESSAEWFSTTTALNSIVIDALSPASLYEFNIMSICQRNNSTPTMIESFETNAINDSSLVCGVLPPEISQDCPPDIPLLQVSDYISSGGSKIKITEITSQNNGVISGNGIATLPNFNFVRIKVTIDNVSINACKEHISGKIYAD